MEKPIMQVGIKKGEMDFGVSGGIGSLSLEEMDEFRKMVMVAIGTAESMWRQANQMRGNAASTTINP